jgi:hypothetical protein
MKHNYTFKELLAFEQDIASDLLKLYNNKYDFNKLFIQTGRQKMFWRVLLCGMKVSQII